MKLPQRLPIVCSLLLLISIMPAWAADDKPDDQPVELKMIAHEAVDGDDGAQLLYGLAYLEGRNNLKPDAAKAVYWLRRSARAENAYAQMLLGNCYAEGTGVKKNPEQAVKWWRRSAEKGNDKAQYLLGKAYLEGNGINKDTKRAISLITQSAEQGNKDAQYLLGKIYYKGHHVAADEETAINWLRRAASQAHTDAITLLSIIKKFVSSSTITYQQSAEALLNKAEHGDPQAEYELGLRYESGAWDVKKDNKQALKWITKAANDGNPVAMKTLANIYQHGDLGLAIDSTKAAEWQKKAANSRHRN